MALKFEVPTLIKIREGIRVNLCATVTHAVEDDKPQLEVKPEVIADIRAGKRAQQTLTEKDYVEVSKGDTVSFWFIGGTSVQYVAGRDITHKDYDRIKDQLQSLELQYRDRKPSDDKTDKTVK